MLRGTQAQVGRKVRARRDLLIKTAVFEVLERRINFGVVCSALMPPGGPCDDNGESGSEASGEEYSMHPVRYGDGVPIVQVVDLQSSTGAWQVGRAWNSAKMDDYAIPWEETFGGGLPETAGVWQIFNPHIAVFEHVDGNLTEIWAQFVRSSYDRDPIGITVDANQNITDYHALDPRMRIFESTFEGADVWIVDDRDGSRYIFSRPHPVAAPGQVGPLIKYFAPRGDCVVTTNYNTTTNRLDDVYVLKDNPSPTSDDEYEWFEYDYGGYGELRSIKHHRKSGSSWSQTRRVEYSYYGEDVGKGVPSHLRSATVVDPTAGNAVVSREFYRYDFYTDPGEEWSGYRLAAVVGAESYLRLDAEAKRLALADGAIPDTADTIEELTGYLSAEDWKDLVNAYADNQFEYDGIGRVTKEIARGAGCSCAGNGGAGTYDFTYGDNPRLSPVFDQDYNDWQSYTREEFRPEGTGSPLYTKHVFTNHLGQAILAVTDEGSVSRAKAFRYDGEGRLLFRAHPSAVDITSSEFLSSGSLNTSSGLAANDDLLGYTPSTGGFSQIRDNDGLLELFGFYGEVGSLAGESTAAGVEGLRAYDAVQRGDLTAVRTVDAITRSASTATVTVVGGVSGYAVGDLVTIWGSADSAAYHGTFTITSVGSGTISFSVSSSLPASVDPNPNTIYILKPQATKSLTYLAHTYSDTTSTRYPTATRTEYHAADQGGKATTTYTYTWYKDASNDSTHAMQTVAMTLPAVATGKNGSGSADRTETSYLDQNGRVIWFRDGDGYITHTDYDLVTGGVKKRIVDVDTSQVTGEPFEGTGSAWTTPSGGGLHLETTYVIDLLGRPTKITDPAGNVTRIVYDDIHEGGINYAGSSMTVPDDGHEVWVYPGWSEANKTTVGPVMIFRGDEISREVATNEFESFSYDEVIEVTKSSAWGYDSVKGAPSADETITSLTLRSLRREYTNRGGQVVDSDRYVHFSGTAYVANGVNYGETSSSPEFGAATGTSPNRYRTNFWHDKQGRVARTVHPTGTIEWSVFDVRGLLLSSWIGTDDTGATAADPSNGGANNMKRIAAYEYDNAGVGDGILTKATASPTPSTTANDRISRYAYDWRNRLVGVKGGWTTDDTLALSSEDTLTQREVLYLEYDQQDRPVLVERYDGDRARIVTDADGDRVPDRPSYPSGTTASQLRAKVEYAYDEQGRTYRQTVYDVDPSTGNIPTVGGSLATDRFYDDRDNVIKVRNPNGPAVKYRYDGANRTTSEAWIAGDLIVSSSPEEPLPGTSGAHAEAAANGDDVTVAQLEWLYDKNDNVILEVRKDRFHSEATTEVGPLAGPTGTGANARVSYVLHYYDSLDRLKASVNLGTNGGDLDAASAGADLDANNDDIADVPASVPGRHDRVLLTEYEYDAAGHLQVVVDPKEHETHRSYDALGRVTRVIEAYDNGVMETTDSGRQDDDRTTEYTYDGNDHVLTLKALLPGSQFQTTEYVYAKPSGATGSDITSNDLLWAVKYPTKTGTNAGQPDDSSKEVYTYNALGEAKTYIDRNATKHTYAYDVQGRLLEDDVYGNLGSGVNGDVTTLRYRYDSAGRPWKFTSVRRTGASSETTVNEVLREYNGFGQVVIEYQEHAGTVSTLINGSPRVKYAYSEAADGANHSRLTSLTYPNAEVLRYEYGQSSIPGDLSDDLNDALSRISYLADDVYISKTDTHAPGTHLEEFSWLGLDQGVQRHRPEPGVNLTYVKDSGDTLTYDGGDQYKGLDRFGRIVDQQWDDTGATPDIDRFTYGYDRNGNVLWRDNRVLDSDTNVGDSFDELYHGTTSDIADAGGYDALDRMTNFRRGDISGTTLANLERGQKWTLDALGNWDQVETDADGNGGFETNDNRDHNAQNQITSTQSTTPGYDGNGNLTSLGTTNVYDAWNRLYSTSVDNGRYYVYDALGRRAVEYSQPSISGQGSAGPFSRTNLYYSTDWQVLEEDSTNAAMDRFATVRNVWAPMYIDAMVLRDTELFESGGGGSEGELDDRPTNGATILSPQQLAQFRNDRRFVVPRGIPQTQVVQPRDSEAAVRSGVPDTAAANVPEVAGRLYVQQDANWNVTSVTNEAGVVQERYAYDPYGTATRLTAASGSPGGTDTLKFSWRHQGGRQDAATARVHFRNRDLDTILGRWIQQDPLSYVDGLNLYLAYRGSPANSLDPSGLLVTLTEIAPILEAGANSIAASRPVQQMSTTLYISGGNPLRLKRLFDIKAEAEAYGRKMKERFRCNEGKNLRATDIENAARHAMLQAMLAREFGSGEAYLLGRAHEIGQITLDSKVDEKNNAVGRAIGLAAVDQTDLKHRVTVALISGELYNSYNGKRLPKLKGCPTRSSDSSDCDDSSSSSSSESSSYYDSDYE